MNLNTSDIATPTNRRSKLGLRRSRKSLLQGDSSSSLGNTPTSSQPSSSSNVTSSASKILDSQTFSNVTPRNVGLKRLSESTNCRPYRLTLNRTMREKLSKKRLQFYLANEAEITSSQELVIEETQTESLTRTDLMQQICSLQKELREVEKHQKKVADLNQAISVWQQGFTAALDDLQSKFERPVTKTQLLQYLGIDLSLLKYAND